MPRTGSFLPNLSSPLSPTIAASKPPSFGISFAAWAIALIADAAQLIEVTCSSPNVPRLLANPLRLYPSHESSKPNFSIEDVPVTNAAIPSRMFAAVRMRIVSAIDFTPSTTLLSISFAPAMNGCNSSMKADKFLAITGSPLETALPKKPPTIFPKNSPIAVPIFEIIGIPVLRNSSNCGKRVTRAPIPIIKPPIPAISVANAPIPINAALRLAPTAPRITKAADIASNNVDNATAVSIEGSTLKCAINPRITANSPTTNPIHARAPILAADVPFTRLNISIADAIVFSNNPRATAVGIDASTSRAFITPRMIDNSPTTNPISANVPMVLLITDFVFPSINIAAAMEANKIASDPAV